MMLATVCVVFLTILLPVNVVGVGSEPEKTIKRHRDMWHDFKLPLPLHSKHGKVVLSQGVADFHHHNSDTRHRLALQPGNLACDQACQDLVAKNITKEAAEESLVYEKVDDNGVKTIFRLPLDGPFVDYINKWASESEKLLEESNESHNRRNKREIFQFDTRFPIRDPLVYEDIPFSAAVAISTGCSGILIGPQYVLTAAHCIHNGKKYIAKMKDIKAGFRRDRVLEAGDDVSQAYYWIRATEAFLPYEWTASKKGKRLPVEKDYAVIKLKRESDRAYLNISVGTPENVASGTRLHIPAFDRSEDPTLIYRFCRVEDGTQEVMYQMCDSEEAAVGAGVYVRRWDREAKKWQRKVVAIYGGKASFYRDHNRMNYNVALRITPLKFAQICFWTTGSYGGCKG